MKTTLKYLKKKTLPSPLEFLKSLITLPLFICIDKGSVSKFFSIHWCLLGAKHFTSMNWFPFHNL